MKKCQLKIKNGVIVSHKITIAENFYDRLKGLMFTKEISCNEAIWIRDCQSIHTFFMYFPIDVAFINSDLKVVRVIRGMKPWRMSWFYFKADSVIEMKSGCMPASVVEGKELELVCTN